MEGGEGSGKSTQALHLRKYFKNKGYRVRIVQEPGETRIGRKIRKILLNPKHHEMAAITEVLLYISARAQLVEEIIIPELKRGCVIICDRYIDSSMAYQGIGRGLGLKTVGLLNSIAIQGKIPDITFYFDLNPEIGLVRKYKSTHGKMDRMESESRKFHQKIRKCYLQLAKKESKRIQIIQANRPAEKIWNLVKEKIDKYLFISKVFYIKNSIIFFIR